MQPKFRGEFSLIRLVNLQQKTLEQVLGLSKPLSTSNCQRCSFARPFMVKIVTAVAEVYFWLENCDPTSCNLTTKLGLQ